MTSTQVHAQRLPSAALGVAKVSVHQVDRDTPGLLVPRPETQIVVRFGSTARGGLDIHALGARQQVHRKLLCGGHRTLAARLRLGEDRAAFGVPASHLAGQVIALEDLWGASARELADRLAGAPDIHAAASILEGAVTKRVVAAEASTAVPRMALDAAQRLQSANVEAVATDLGVSSRHLRRVFRAALGVSPKAFARIERFRRVLRAVRERPTAGWADVAAGAGYYDQAHLIAEFRAIAGVTPSALREELRVAPSIG